MRTIRSKWLFLAAIALAAPLGAWERTGELAPPAVKKEQDQILKALTEGNKQHMKNISRKPGEPKIMIVSCADSRVPPEAVFHLKAGEIYTTRAFGTIVDESILASLEYGAEHLNARVLVVLGHTNCSALKEAIDEHDHPRAQWHSLNQEDLNKRLQPAVDAILDKSLVGEARLDAVVRSNVLNTIRTIRERSLVLWNLEQDDMIKIMGAIYHLDTGKVEWIKQ